MKENFILIENIKEAELEKILENLSELYSETPFVNGIQLYRRKGDINSFLVLFANTPDFERFNYFVNYIRYPEGFRNFSPALTGYFKTGDIHLKADFKTGEWMLIYVSQTDKEFDNVTLVNQDNESYLYSFNGSIKKIESAERKFELISIDLNDYHHIIDIYPANNPSVTEVRPWWKFW